MNLIKGNDVIGHKVITLKSGKEVGKVSDVVYDPGEQRVKAFLVDEGHWFGNGRAIPLSDIKSIGKDAVIIDSENLVRRVSDVMGRETSLGRNGHHLAKTRVVTDTGTDLGRVSDIYFDPGSGDVEELEVTQGLADIQSGKKAVKVGSIITVGEDATIVEKTAEDEITKQAQSGGVYGAVNKARGEVEEKGPGIVEEIWEKSEELWNKARNVEITTGSAPSTSQKKKV